MSTNTNKLSDGKHIFKVRGTDGFGNWSQPQSIIFKKDTEGPIIGHISYNVIEPGEISGLGDTHYYVYIKIDSIKDEHSGPKTEGSLSFKQATEDEWVTIPTNLDSLGAYIPIGTTLPSTGQVKITWQDNAGNETIRYRNIYLSNTVTSEGTNVGGS